MATKDISDLQVLEAFRDCQRGGPPYSGHWPYELLQARTGEPFKVCWRAMERAFGRDLVDYGINLRSGWLTDKGKALLQCGESSGTIAPQQRGGPSPWPKNGADS